MRNIFSPFAAKQKPKAVSLRTSDRCHWCGNPFPRHLKNAIARQGNLLDKLKFVGLTILHIR